MFELNNKPTVQSVQGSGGLGGSIPQAPGGVSSALKDLFAEVSELRNRAENLRSGLGISFPEKAVSESAPSSSLRDFLREATYVVHRANGDLADCLEHLNS